MSEISPVIPPTITRNTPTPSRTISNITSAAPIPRGTPCLRIQATSGEATAAMIPAVITGSTITFVSERSHTAPDEEDRHADQQPGGEPDVAQPVRDDEDPAQVAERRSEADSSASPSWLPRRWRPRIIQAQSRELGGRDPATSKFRVGSLTTNASDATIVGAMPTRRLPAVIVGAFVAALVSMPGTASAYTARVETNPVSGIKFLHVFTSTATVTADSFEAEDVGGNEVKITGRDAAIAGSGCTPSGRSVTCDAGAVVQVDVFAGNDRVIIDSAPQPVVVFAGTGDDEIRVDQATVNTDVFAFATGILGEEGDDLIIGSTGPDFFDGRDGDDVLVGKGGDDSINGDVGGDVMSGGTGVDQVTYLEGTDTGRDLGITVHVGDGICNDGSAEDDAVGNRAPVSRDVTSTCGNGNAVERDEVLGDVESLLGTNGDDSIIGNSSSGTIVGLAGEDLLEGAGGADSVLGEGSIPAGFFGGQPPDGDDTLLLRDGVTDFSSFCGGGSADRAVADPGDPVSFDCETVERGAAGVTGPATDGLAPPVVVGGAPDPNAPQQPQPVTSPPPPPGTPPTGNDAGGGEPGGGDGGATAPDVRIFGDTLIVDRKRRAQVRITCVYRAEECEGTAELTATKDIGKGRKGFDRGDRVGRTEISIPWGRTGKVPVKVSKDFFAALGEDSTKLKLSVEARDSGAGRNAAVARVSRKMTTELQG